MDLKRIIRNFYIIYTIYVLMVISTTNITFYYILPAIMLMWINYIFFCAGNIIITKNEILYNDSRDWLLNCSKKSLLIIAGFSVLFSLAAAKFYTGQTPITLFWSFANNVSIYYEYQLYFQEQQRNIFSFSKIPFIFMMFYLKFTLFYSYISLLIIKKSTTIFEKFYLGIVTFSSVYFGIARGTNYEFFELVMLIIFIMLSKSRIKKFQLPIKNLTKIFSLIAIMILVFYYGVSARGIDFNYYISSDVSYNPTGLLPQVSPFLSFIVVIIYGYFGFGFFYMASYIRDVWFHSISSLIAGLIPLGYRASTGNTITDVMSSLVDIGAKWHPDSAIIINNVGYFGLILYCFLMGLFARYIYRTKSSNSMVYLTGFIILMQMISLPVGNFVSTSSASQLIVLTLVFYWIWKLLIKVKIKL